MIDNCNVCVHIVQFWNVKTNKETKNKKQTNIVCILSSQKEYNVNLARAFVAGCNDRLQSPLSLAKNKRTYDT